MTEIAYFKLLCLPVFSALGVVLIHLCASRFVREKHWPIIGVAFLVMGLFFVYSTVFVIKQHGILDDGSYFILNTVIFVGLSFGYFTLVNLNITSLRIRLLKIMAAQAPAPVAETALLKDYHPEALVEMRCKRLVQLRQVEPVPEGYQLIRKEIVYLSRMIQWFRRQLNIRIVRDV